MNVAVRARNIDLPAEAREAAEHELRRLARRVGGMDRAQVRFLAERGRRGPGPGLGVCEVTMHGHGHVVRARGAGDDWPAAVVRTVDKLERQVERLRAKLRDRARCRDGISVHFPAHDADRVAPSTDESHTVTARGTTLQPLTPEEAALEMDRTGHHFQVFVNVENGSTGVVFRRTDGHIGLIDPG